MTVEDDINMEWGKKETSPHHLTVENIYRKKISTFCCNNTQVDKGTGNRKVNSLQSSSCWFLIEYCYDWGLAMYRTRCLQMMVAPWWLTKEKRKTRRVECESCWERETRWSCYLLLNKNCKCLYEIHYLIITRDISWQRLVVSQR